HGVHPCGTHVNGDGLRGEADEQTADGRSLEAAESSHGDADETVEQDVEPEAWIDLLNRGGDDPGAKGDAGGEEARDLRRPAHRDADRLRSAGVFGDRLEPTAEAGALPEGEEPEIEDDGGPYDEDADGGGVDGPDVEWAETDVVGKDLGIARVRQGRELLEDQ